jgi:MoxR-like ATPase
MKPSEVLSSLQVLAQIRKPAFLWGPPGVGKSQIVAQVAASLGIRLIDIRAVLLDPVDLRGLPTVEHGKAAWAIPAFLPEDGAGILFLDELNAATPLVQAACYQLVLDRAWRIPAARWLDRLRRGESGGRLRGHLAHVERLGQPLRPSNL